MQTIVNLGTGGADLNGQNGSTTSEDSNDALFLDWPGDNGGNYVYLPGVSGNYLSVPDEAALDITGDIDLRVQVAFDDWTPASQTTLITKAASGGQFSFQWDLRTNGEMKFYWSTDGSTTTSEESDAVPGFADGEVKWLRVTMDVDNGAGGYEVKFYTSDDGTTWSQSGSTDTGGSTTSIYSGSGPVRVGGTSTVGSLSAKVYRAQILDGIGGTTVLDVDCSQLTSGGATSFTALTGQTVSINRSTSGRKAVAVVSPVWLFGTDDYMEVADNDLIDFGASDSFTVLAVVRQWATPIANAKYLSKGEDSRWFLYNTSPSLRAIIDDDTTAATMTAGNYDVGVLTALSLTVNRDTQQATLYENTSSGTAVDISAVGSLANAGSLYVGKYTTSYQDFEFLAAAVFRRALTAGEIATLTSYYQARLS